MGRNLTMFEKAAYKKGFKLVAGIDEAGRGPLAGPVVAAVCILPQNVVYPDVDDSKKLTPQQRDEIYAELTTDSRIHYAVGLVSHAIIDVINIYQATIQAMLQAVAALKIVPDLLMVDGLQLPHPTIPVQKIIAGDAQSQSIAAASILAKVTRDRIMVNYHVLYPDYGFDQHKGYATEKHREALLKHGPCPIHRRTFNSCKPEEHTTFAFIEG